jgi:hypothetical protein
VEFWNGQGVTAHFEAGQFTALYIDKFSEEGCSFLRHVGCTEACPNEPPSAGQMV